MTKERNPHDHGDLVSEAKRQNALMLQQEVERRLLERNSAGQFVSKVADHDWDWIIEQVRAGNTDANIVRNLEEIMGESLGRGLIAVKRRQDPAFAQRYSEALEDAFINIAQETRDVARGVPGYSTGDVQRDRLVVETDLKLASKFARKIMGDKALIEAQGVQIVVRNDHGPDDVC